MGNSISKESLRTIRRIRYHAINNEVSHMRRLVESLPQPVRDQVCKDTVKLATSQGHVEVAHFLVNGIEDETLRNQCCLEAAETAAKEGRLDINLFLINKITEPNCRDECCSRIVDTAMSNKQWAIVEVIVPMFPHQRKRDRCYEKAAESAFLLGEYEAAISFSKKVEEKKLRNNCLATFIDIEISRKRWKGVEKLLEAIDDPHLKTEQCMKAADSAVINNQLDLARNSIENIPDLSSRQKLCVRAAESLAARDDHVELMTILLKNVFDKKEREDLCHRAAEMAALNGNSETVNFLLRNISDDKLRDDYRFEAAESAMNGGHLNLLRSLIQQVRDANRRQEYCMTRANYAAASGNQEVVRVLLDCVDPSLIDQCCLAVADSAAGKQEWEVVKVLEGFFHNDSLKDQCFTMAAGKAVEKRSWDVAHQLILEIGDRKLRSQCCMTAANDAVQCGEAHFLNIFLREISDKHYRDAFCESFFKPTIVKRNLDVVDVLVQNISDPHLKDKCLLIAADSARGASNLPLLEFFLLKVNDRKRKNSYCTEAVNYLANEKRWEVVGCILRISNADISDKLHKKAAELAAMEADWYWTLEFAKAIRCATLKYEFCAQAADNSLAIKNMDFFMHLLQTTVSDPKLRDDCLVKAAESAIIQGHFGILKDLLQLISDQFAKDRYCQKALENAMQKKNWTLAMLLLKQISQDGIRQACCERAADLAANDYNFEALGDALQEYTDATSRNQYCIKGAESAARNSNFELLRFFLPAIDNQTQRDKCCLAVLDRAIVLGNMNVLKFVVQLISDPKLKNASCTRAADHAIKLGDWNCLAFFVHSLSDQCRDEYCKKAAESTVENCQLEQLTFFLKTISRSNIREQCCIKVIEQAVQAKEWEFLKDAISIMSELEQRDYYCITAIDFAAKAENWRIARYLLPLINEGNLKDHCCMKIAESASVAGSTEIANFFAENISHAKLKEICYIRAIEASARNGRFSTSRSLLQSFIEADNVLSDQSLVRIAASAAQQKKWEEVTFFIRKVSDQRCRDEFCFGIAVNCARKMQKTSLGSFLAAVKPLYFTDMNEAAHADSSSVESVVPPHWLSRNSSLLSLLSYLVLSKDTSILLATVSQMQPAQITQLLCLCITHGHVALALFLIDCSQAYVDLPDCTGATALMLAADSDHHELIEPLINAGASVHLADFEGRTALSRASEAGHVRTAEALKNRGANQDHLDKRGLTCKQLLEKHQQLSQQQHDVDSYSQFAESFASANADYPADIGILRLDRQISRDLYEVLLNSGFTKARAQSLQRMANILEQAAQDVLQDGRRITGSYAEGWANNMEQVNGRVSTDSDIDFTILLDGPKVHLEGGCRRSGDCDNYSVLKVIQGHAQFSVGSGSQPAVRADASGLLPAQDTCHAIQCCSGLCEDRVKKLLPRCTIKVHLVRATRPNFPNELRVSFSFHEKEIMMNLGTVQGQLFTLIKFVFKIYLPRYLDAPGLKTYHAKTLLFFMLERHSRDAEAAWQPQNLIERLKESLGMMLNFMDSRRSPDECMPHFFMDDAPLYFKNAGAGDEYKLTKSKVRDGIRLLRTNTRNLVDLAMENFKPLPSHGFYFHLFCMLPLVPFSATNLSLDQDSFYSRKYYSAYTIITHVCVIELQSKVVDKESLFDKLNLLKKLPWCTYAADCLLAIAHIKFGDFDKADGLLSMLMNRPVPQVKRSWKISEIERYEDTDSNWAWRFCLPCDTPPQLPFLPEFTQCLFTPRLLKPRSSHLYVNFRCLSWSLQAERLRNANLAEATEQWFKELHEDPDLEELHTLAHYSWDREHHEFCLQQMNAIALDRRTAMENKDEERIRWVKERIYRSSDECFYFSSKERVAIYERWSSRRTMASNREGAGPPIPPRKSVHFDH